MKKMPDDFEARLRKSTLRLSFWTAAWILTTALLGFGPQLLWNRALAITLLALAVNVLVGLGMIVANTHFMQNLDELQRQVQLQAMGITLGIGLIVGIPYSLMDAYDVVPFDAEIAHLVALMGLTFLTCVLLAARRYR